LRFAQPRAIGLKVSDEFTVPLCRGHHRQLHQTGNEVAWWEDLHINALEIARGLWEQTHPESAAGSIFHAESEPTKSCLAGPENRSEMRRVDLFYSLQPR